MSETPDELGLFLHLARASELRRQPMVRDRLLVIAAAIAAERGLSQIAAFCRHKVLKHNPGHLLRRWPNVETAADDEAFQTYVRQMRRRYAREKAEQILSSLGIEMGRERQTYYTDHEYAAAILGTTPEALEDMFGTAE